MTEENATSDVTHWTLSDQQALTALQSSTQIPLPGSPLRDLADHVPNSPAAPPQGSAFAKAWERLLRPDYVLKLRANPSLDPTNALAHYAFAGDTRFVRYRRAASGSHHLEWPHRTGSLIAACNSILGQDSPPTIATEALILEQDGYAALLAAGDCIHEEALQAALERRDPQPVRLTPEVLLACFQRAAGGVGLLWLSGRGSMFAPGRIKPTLPGLRHGLNALAAAGLILPAEKGFFAGEPFARQCRLLSGEARFVSLSQHQRVYDDAGFISWDKKRLTVMRTSGAVWLFAFEPGPDGTFTTQISTPSPDDVSVALQAALTPPQDRAARPEAPPLPPTAIAPLPPQPDAPAPHPAPQAEPGEPTSAWYVVAARGERKGMRFDIVDQLRIGREADCNVRLTGNVVSRQHAVLLLGSRGLVARDLNSTNGTFVNGLKIKEDVVLQVGDTVDVGETRLRVAGPAHTVVGATIQAAPPPPGASAPPAYVPPERPAGQAHPVSVSTAPPLVSASQAPAPPVASSPTRNWAVALLALILALCVGLVGLFLLYAAGFLTLPV